MRRSILCAVVGVLAGLEVFAQPAAGTGSTGRTAEKQTAAPAFGTADPSYVRQSFAEFSTTDPVNSPYGDIVGPNFGRYATGSGFLIGPHPRIPGGALLTYLELDACDFHVPGFVRLQLYACDYLGVCGFDPLVDLATSPSSAPGCVAVTAHIAGLGYVVNNLFGELVPLITTSQASSSTYLLGVIYGYTLQVSPPPPTATFNDVPPGHPQYPFVEALARAGITVGCGGGAYCPDHPITRGQMAVFLAKALGLHWAGF